MRFPKTLIIMALFIGAAIFLALAQVADVARDSCIFVEDGFGPSGTISIRTEVVVNGLEVPWAIAFLPSGEWLVTERPGRVRLIRNGVLQEAPVLELALEEIGEGGLLGLVIHPRFAENSFFYVYHTITSSGGGAINRVSRYRLSVNRRTATLDRVILDGIPASPVHDGGRLRFGPDGMLYVSTGDAGVPNRAQRNESLSGKILRITPEGGVPRDNPVPGSLVYVSGIRNSQAFDWLDRSTLIVADHGPSGDLGQTGRDEVNFAVAGDNLGWPTVTGCQTSPGKVRPAISWKSAVPPGGGSVYRGDKIPEWRDNFIMGTLGSTHLHRLVIRSGSRGFALHEVYLSGERPSGYGRLRDVQQGPDGYLYVTTSNCDSRAECPPEKDVIIKISKQ